MPELPEVETVVRFLQPHIVGQTICGVEFPWPKACAGLPVAQFRKNLIGGNITAIERRGKYIIFRTGPAWFTVHLRMTGHLYPAERDLTVIMSHSAAGWIEASILFFVISENSVASLG